MRFATANGEPIVSGSITLPRIGPWTADITLAPDAVEPLAGRVELRLGSSLRWAGTVRRSGAVGGLVHALIVGGAGGLAKTVPPKAYQGVPLHLPLQDILSAVGERLAPSSDSSVLGTMLRHWGRMQSSGGMALAALLAAAGAPAWRVLADGTLWVGRETWPEAALTEFSLALDEPHRGECEVVSVEPTVQPGQAFRGQKVSRVEHRLGGAIRTHIWTEGAA